MSRWINPKKHTVTVAADVVRDSSGKRFLLSEIQADPGLTDKDLAHLFTDLTARLWKDIHRQEHSLDQIPTEGDRQ